MDTVEKKKTLPKQFNILHGLVHITSREAAP